jgi:hypothetical protein
MMRIAVTVGLVRDGYNLMYRKYGGMTFWPILDLNGEEQLAHFYCE